MKVTEIIQQLSLIGQLGLSIMMPTLMCLGACWYLSTRMGLGLWVYIPGFILGLGSSFMTAYKVYLAAMKKQAEAEKKHPARFASNYHR